MIIINNNKRTYKMKKIVIILLISLSFNAYSNEIVTVDTLEHHATTNPNKEKIKNIKSVESLESAKATIEAMEKKGWSYDRILKNKDGSFTLFFSKEVEESSLRTTSDTHPDGTYIGHLGNATIENTYKNGKLVKRVVNGEEVDLETWQ
jgi:hypothetical protein